MLSEVSPQYLIHDFPEDARSSDFPEVAHCVSKDPQDVTDPVVPVLIFLALLLFSPCELHKLFFQGIICPEIIEILNSPIEQKSSHKLRHVPVFDLFLGLLLLHNMLLVNKLSFGC